jgi:lipoyl(octanoyl) transferase
MRVERMGTSIPYGPMFALQEARHHEVRVDSSRETLFLLEHTSVVTLGKNASDGNLRLSHDEYASRGIEVVETGRGGDVTWHGPGQIVGYPILHFAEHERDIRKYVWNLEEVMIRTAGDYGVVAERVEGLRGIWVGEEKLAAIGVRIARWTTLHGFAFNVQPDLGNFDLIVPCGIEDKGVTSLQKLLGPSCPTLVEVQSRLCAHLSDVLQRKLMESIASPLPKHSTDD